MSTPLTVSLRFTPDDVRPVGRLAMQGRAVFFEWAADALAEPLGLSAFRLPEEPGVVRGEPDPFEGLPGLFGDSLPDAWGRLLIDRAFRRAVSVRSDCPACVKECVLVSPTDSGHLEVGDGGEEGIEEAGLV